MAAWQIVEAQISDSNAYEPFHFITNLLKHAANLTIYALAQSDPQTCWGDGMQTRDYIPVKDVVQANIVLGVCEKQLMQGEMFNIATGKNKNLFELIDMLKEKYIDYQGLISFMPARPGDVKHISADCSKYNILLNCLINE